MRDVSCMYAGFIGTQSGHACLTDPAFVFRPPSCPGPCTRTHTHTPHLLKFSIRSSQKVLKKTHHSMISRAVDPTKTRDEAKTIVVQQLLLLKIIKMKFVRCQIENTISLYILGLHKLTENSAQHDLNTNNNHSL